MSYTVSGHIEGIDELKVKFNASPAIIDKHVGNALVKTAFLVEGKAKQYAPVKYGILRGSINSQGPFGQGGDLHTKVGTNIEYARHQEYGTGIYGKNHTPITPKRKKVLAWKSGGKWHFAKRVRGTKGKFYMKQAKEDGKRTITDEMRKAMKNITQELSS